MQKNIKEKLMKIFTLEFWFLGIPFLFAALVFSLWFGFFPGKNLFTYLFPHNHEYFFTYFLLYFVAAFYLVIRVCKTKTNNKEKSLVNFLKTRSKKFIFLSLFVVWQYFNFTGFCYEEMKYLSDKELIDKVVEREFVMKDEEARKKALNKECSDANFYYLTESELNQKFPTKQCAGKSYSSLKEFYKQGLNEKCPEDKIKYASEILGSCGVFYYASIEEFYEENQDCCKVEVPSNRIRNLMGITNGYFILDRLFGRNLTSVVVKNLLDGNWYRDGYQGDIIFINYCGDPRLPHGIEEGIRVKDYQNYLKQKK